MGVSGNILIHGVPENQLINKEAFPLRKKIGHTQLPHHSLCMSPYSAEYQTQPIQQEAEYELF